MWSKKCNNLNSENVRKKTHVLDWNNYKIRRTAAQEICDRHHGSSIEGSPETPIHHCTMVLRVSTGAPIWSHYVKKHKPLGQQSQLFPVRKYFTNDVLRHTHRNDRPLHDKLNGICEDQKLPIFLEPTLRLIPWQSGSSRGIFYPVQLDKNQKLISLCFVECNC